MEESELVPEGWVLKRDENSKIRNYNDKNTLHLPGVWKTSDTFMS